MPKSGRAGQRHRPFAAYDHPVSAANGSATNGASLTATYNVPNTIVQSLLGRLPSNSNANGTTAVNLVEAAQVYGERVTQIDMRFAKVLRFGGRRADVGVDLYNLFNTNDAAGYEQTFDYATQGATWLRPTSIVPPRFAKVERDADLLARRRRGPASRLRRLWLRLASPYIVCPRAARAETS